MNNIKLSDKELADLTKKDKYRKITSSITDNGTYNLTIEETEKLK